MRPAARRRDGQAGSPGNACRSIAEPLRLFASSRWDGAVAASRGELTPVRWTCGLRSAEESVSSLAICSRSLDLAARMHLNSSTHIMAKYCLNVVQAAVGGRLARHAPIMRTIGGITVEISAPLISLHSPGDWGSCWSTRFNRLALGTSVFCPCTATGLGKCTRPLA